MTVLMLPEADSVVRQLMPSVLDAAGLHGPAERLRSIGVLTFADAVAACAVMEEASSDGGLWPEAVREASFWGMAALWAARDGQPHTFEYSVRKVGAVLRDCFSGPPFH